MNDALDEIAASLRARRHGLVSELERLTEPLEERASVSFGKRVGDGTTEAVERFSTVATARSISASIENIDRALWKIDAGTYGTCDSCGETITLERLEALPASALCVTCAARS